MAAIDNLKEAIEGIANNWPIIGKFVSGGPTDTVETGAGDTPVIAKVVQDATTALDQAKTDLIAQKDVEINQLASGVLARSASAADISTAKATEAGGSAASAAGSATAAQLARDAALIQSGVYVSEPIGRAAVADGQAFKVQGDGTTVAAYEYRRVNAATPSTLIASYPAAQAVATLQSAVVVAPSVDQDIAFRLVDSDGYVLATIGRDGTFNSIPLKFVGGIASKSLGVADKSLEALAWPSCHGAEPVNVTVDAEGFVLTAAMLDGTILTPEGTLGARWIEAMAWPPSHGDEPVNVTLDREGFVLTAVRLDGSILTPAGPLGAKREDESSFQQEEIDARNAQNLVYSQKLKSQINTNFQKPVFDYNIIVTYGQSLSNGFRSFPAISVLPRAQGLYMLGDSVRPIGVTGDTRFQPVGGVSTLKPLAASVQDYSGKVITDYSTLDPTGGAMGESLSEAQASFIKIMTARQMNLRDDSGPQFVVVNCGVDGKSVEELSKGADINLYARVIDAVTQVKNIATAQGKTCGVVVLNYNQGEWNYGGVRGATRDKAAYKDLLLTLIRNLQADLSAITKQSLPFLTLLGQTGAGYTVDSTNLSIGTAQAELGQQNANVRLATPYYPLPVKDDGHFEANGARWFGCMFGKVAYRMLRGEDWQPLSLRTATRRGLQVLLDFTVPEPPIRLALPFVGGVRADIAGKGFSCVDASGVMLPTKVTVVSDTQILLTLPRPPSGSLSLRIADQTNCRGRTCVQDSDGITSMEKYYYADNNGQAATERVGDLLDSPYPLQNWLVAGQYAVTTA
ncbi:hypothetical protein [Caballeronia sp. LjRoot31]|uniref:hypothetical protein n=1 Tax=Caballeronia sp. LjRoot31 TaxID=3342324 RepID=UPI003ECE9EF5